MRRLRVCFPLKLQGHPRVRLRKVVQFYSDNVCCDHLALFSCSWALAVETSAHFFSRWRPTRIVAWLISTRCPDEVRHGEPASCEITTIVCAFLLMSRLQEWFSWVCVHVMYRRAVASVQLASSMPCRMGTLKNVYTLWGAILSPNKNHHLFCLHFLSWKICARYFQEHHPANTHAFCGLEYRVCRFKDRRAR